MNGIVRLPPFQFFHCLTAVRQDLVVHGFNLTGRCHGRNQAGNRRHNHARLALTFAQSFLGPLQIIDVVDRSVPMHDPTLGVTQRLSNGLSPSELTV